MVLQVGLQPVLGAFGCVFGGHATKSTVLVRPKGLYCVNFELGGQISMQLLTGAEKDGNVISRVMTTCLYRDPENLGVVKF
jgi:hypothetical protein